MIAGGTTVLVWGNIKQANDFLNPIVPGFAMALAVAVAASLLARPAGGGEGERGDVSPVCGG